MKNKIAAKGKTVVGGHSPELHSICASEVAAIREIMKILGTQNIGVIYDFLAYLRRLKREET